MPRILSHCWKDGSEPDVVRARSLCCDSLLKAMGRDPDEFVLAKQSSREFDREVVLPKVHTVSINCRRDVGMVIDNETRPCVPGDPGKHQCSFIDALPRAVLVPILEKRHSGVERLLHRLQRVDAKKGLIEDQTEPSDIIAPVYCTAP